MTRKEYGKVYYHKNKESILKQNRESYLRHKKSNTKKKKEYYEKNKKHFIDSARRRNKVMAKPEKDVQRNNQRRRELLRKYGISLEQYDSMVKRCSSRCAICGIETKLCVDHSHTTGEVRGLLCGNCNRGLGCFKDNPEALKMAISYLLANRGVTI